ncbi:leucine-rich repeat domain-containing protein [Noviherbaspirillum pedocola]|uniref:Uncharacterized protein n=1 Tax=Noviherbaspirillum pedocola TaxID=2801341 RepID=A0A934SSP7_9BURK|nr:hypothetical protein [Noviherbaspirillum pedocola]MBK4734481.1 hypothetical protein [Noviherbaspirillum pedocola]
MDAIRYSQRSTDVPGSAQDPGVYTSKLSEWARHTTCSQAQEVVKRIQQWRGGDPSSQLDLTHCDLDECPPLPFDLQNVNLSWNPRLSALPQRLPDSLVSLAVMFCNLSALPAQWPPCLEKLIIASNCVAALPENLPDSVRTIGAANNRIEQVPAHLPARLESLGIGTNRIAHVPMGLLSMPNLKELALANNPLTPACIQELRQASALPDYAGPTITIGEIGEYYDASEILPASRAADTVRIVPAHPARAQVNRHLQQGAQYVAWYADSERTIVRPYYRDTTNVSLASALMALNLSDESSEES